MEPTYEINDSGHVATTANNEARQKSREQELQALRQEYRRKQKEQELRERLIVKFSNRIPQQQQSIQKLESSIRGREEKLELLGAPDADKWDHQSGSTDLERDRKELDDIKHSVPDVLQEFNSINGGYLAVREEYEQNKRALSAISQRVADLELEERHNGGEGTSRGGRSGKKHRLHVEDGLRKKRRGRS